MIPGPAGERPPELGPHRAPAPARRPTSATCNDATLGGFRAFPSASGASARLSTDRSP